MKAPGPWSISETLPQHRYWFYHAWTGSSNERIQVSNATMARTGFNDGPGWRQRRALGTLAPHPASLIRSNVWKRGRESSFSVLIPDLGRTNAVVSGHSLMYSSSDLDMMFPGSVALVTESAQQDFVKRARNVQFSIGTFMGELHKTAGQMAKNSNILFNRIESHEKDVLKNILQLKRSGVLRGDTASKVLDVASNRWLEFQMSTKPMVHDMEDLGIALARMQVDNPRTRVIGKSESNFSKTVTETYAPPFIGRCGNTSITYERKVQVKIGATAAAHLTVNDSPLTLLGLDWSDVLPTLWELIPYSYLIDYFTNVGNMIESVSVHLPPLKHTWSVTVVEDIAAWTAMLQDGLPDRSYRYIGSAETGSSQSFKFIRSVDPELIPEYSFIKSENLSLTKQWNLAALVTQLLMRQRKFAHILGFRVRRPTVAVY